MIKKIRAPHPPTACVDQDEYGSFVVSPASLLLDLTQGDRIRLLNVSGVRVDVDLRGPLKAMPGRFKLGKGSDRVVKIGTRVRGSYPYIVSVGRFEARGGSGPKVIVDP